MPGWLPEPRHCCNVHVTSTMMNIAWKPKHNTTAMSKRAAPTPPTQSKKLRNSTLSAKYRAEQYTDFYASGDTLFCKCCQRSVDWTRKDTCDDHIASKIHVKNKEKQRASQSRPALQTTITASTTSADARREFIQDYVAVCAESDIPLHKLKKLRPFLVKHCKQGGALLLYGWI